VFDDAVEGSPGMGAGSATCSNPKCTDQLQESSFQVYLSDRSEASTRQHLQTHGLALEQFAEDWIRLNPGGYLGTRDRNGSYRWGSSSIDESSSGKFEVSSVDDHRKESEGSTLQEAAMGLGESGQSFISWLRRAELLEIYSVEKSEYGGAIEIRFPPGGHGLYYVPLQSKDQTLSYLLSLGPTGSKTSKLGEMKQLSERWFFFRDFAPGWRERER
jgi:hypothetical protein